jgi:hypothetical protein
LRKSVVAVGVIVLLAGLMLVLFSNAATAVNNYNPKVQSYPESSWSISQSFNQDEALGFDFRPHSDWSDNTYDFYYVNLTGSYQAARYLEIAVTNPQSNLTTIRMVLIIDIYAGAGGVTVVPNYFEVYNDTLSDWVRLNSTRGFNDPSGAIVIEKGYPNIIKLPTDVGTWGGGNIFQLGKIATPGSYNLSLKLDPEGAIEPGTNKNRASPPVDLVICETRVNTHHPYGWLLLLGMPTSIVGLAVMVFGARSRKHEPLKRA